MFASSEPTRDPMVDLAAVPKRIPRIDVAIAGGLFLWAMLEALFADQSGPPALKILWAAGFSIPLAWRRRWPLQMLLIVTAVAIWRAAAGHVPAEGAMPMPSVLIGAFSCALYARPRQLAPLGIVLPVLAMVLGVPHDDTEAVDYAILTFIISVAWLSGWLLRRRAEQLEAARRAGPELAREAVSAERSRMARELHDVVAHSVSIISVQAGAAEQQLERDPERARQHLRAVQDSAHEALTELRRMVGLLRDEDASYVPAPGLSRLQDLADQACSGGIAVEIETHGTARSLPAGVDLTAYRVIQEALTNARKHAPGCSAHISVDYSSQRLLALEVRNGPGGRPDQLPSDQHGLIGMAERVRVFGGELQTGPTGDGGFLVHASLPYGDNT